MENNVIERRAIFAGTTFENKIPPQFLRPKIRFLVESLIRGKPASRLCWGGFTLLYWGWFIASPTHFETNPSVLFLIMDVFFHPFLIFPNKVSID